MTVILDVQTGNILSRALDFMLSDAKGAVSQSQMGFTDPREYFYTDGGDLTEFAEEFLNKNKRLPSVRDGLLEDIKNMRASFEYRMKQLTEIAEHKCSEHYPPLEEVGDRALICPVCGCNGDA